MEDCMQGNSCKLLANHVTKLQLNDEYCILTLLASAKKNLKYETKYFAIRNYYFHTRIKQRLPTVSPV
jgi:hypothetical protein